MVIPFQPPIVVRLTITRRRRRRRISHSFIIYRSKQTNQPNHLTSQPSTTLWERAVLMVLIINRNWCCNKKNRHVAFSGANSETVPSREIDGTALVVVARSAGCRLRRLQLRPKKPVCMPHRASHLLCSQSTYNQVSAAMTLDVGL